MNPSTSLRLFRRSTTIRLYRPLTSIAVESKSFATRTPVAHRYSADSFLNTPFSTGNGTKRGFSSMMSMVKELRSVSGAPIVDCKKALTENDGDMEKSLDWLREHGTAKASKKLGDREAEEGLVACAVSEDGKTASIVQISSETDFAGKSDAFVGLACHVAGATLTSSSSGKLDPQATVHDLEFESKSVQTALEDAIVAIRENLGVKQAVKLTTGDDGLLVAYVHGKANGSSNAGLAAAVVEISGEGVINNPDSANEAGRKLAMHIVAAKPAYLSSECVPENVVEKEKAILASQIADSNKPPEVVEKIINGRIRKFYSEVCLTEQEHMVEEGNPKVSKALKEKGLVVKSFEMFSI
uniref:Elongation factor Ts, mitochondrial n=1 Tax=Pseudo-nitzschia australis TaxID=44445 RepID=A0A7S4ABE7_9STRA|mmetsp:Transcript_27362/g.57421  ORF Transcript_27362/g.57421 Transcript_27362/m.57421 type:complete len:355 (+) Transcript_27362:77-1141(+)